MKHDPAQICREGSGRFDGLHCGDLYDTQDTTASLAELVFALVAVAFMSTMAVGAFIAWLAG